MAINSTNSNNLRVGGLATGLDTRTLINDLMRAQRVRVDRLQQQREQVEWRRDAYREITTQLRNFTDEFFNSLRPATDMRSASNLRAMRGVSSDVTSVSVSVTSEALASQVIIAGVDSLATPTSIMGNRSVPAGLTLDSSLEALGFASVGSSANFNINGTDFTFDSTVSMRHVLNTINSNNNAGARMFYSGIEGRFILQSRNTGAATSMNTSGAFLEGLGLAGAGANMVAGTDASVRFQASAGAGIFTVNRNSNTFTLDGVTYSLHRTTASAVTISVEQDTDRAFNAIKGFVDRYNEILGNINNRLAEQRNRNYLPLTETQRNEMSEQEITRWEQRARSGLLNNSPSLNRIVNDMRTAMSDAVQNVSVDLASIGITSGNFMDRGRLTIDEGRLRETLRTNPDSVTDLFTRRSGIAYSPDLSETQRQTRFAESGLAHRLSDIMQDNVRVTRNNAGRRGLLIERAGIANSASEFINELSSEMRTFDDRIDRTLETIEREEQRFWRQFTALEQAMQRMNTQSAWLTQQLGNNQQ